MHEMAASTGERDSGKPRVLICHSTPLESDPDDPVVFWNDHCVGQVVARLKGAGIGVIHYKSHGACVADVLGLIGQNEDIDVLVVFGHGEGPPEPPLIWNRKGRKTVLADERVVEQGAQIGHKGHVLLAAYSCAQFRSAVKTSGLPVLTGFRWRARVPLVGSRRWQAFGADDRCRLMECYCRLFIELVVSLAESLVRCSRDPKALIDTSRGLVEDCRRDLNKAAGWCRERLMASDVWSGHFAGHVCAFACNAEALCCRPCDE